MRRGLEPEPPLLNWHLLGFLISGTTLGLAAGLSPGPLMALLVAQTVRYGVREGVKVAFAPILTDAPIVTVTVLVLSRFSQMSAVLGWISMLGGLYVGWLGVECLRAGSFLGTAPEGEPGSIRKAFAVNLLNPHPYAFWATVGGPMVLRASTGRLAPAIGFVACFYLLLCGSKVVVAVLIHRAGAFLTGPAYARTVQFIGVALLIFAGLLVGEGFQHLNYR